jgi:hypothetical protein
MDIKPRPNHVRYIESLRRMTPALRLAKAFELSEFSRRLFVAGLRKRFPGASEGEIKRIAAKRLLELHNRKDRTERHYAGLWHRNERMPRPADSR